MNLAKQFTSQHGVLLNFDAMRLAKLFANLYTAKIAPQHATQATHQTLL
jgi:hypothetical protein